MTSQQSTQLSTAELAAAGTPEPVDQAPVERRDDDRTAAPEQAQRTPLFAEGDAHELQTRWTDIQASFVDEPRRAVEEADALVADVMQRLARAFADERQNLERQWDRDGDPNTEELRLALQRYRSFFGRLLSL
jgi:hypothetical protein